MVTPSAALPVPFSEREFYLREFRGQDLGHRPPGLEKMRPSHGSVRSWTIWKGAARECCCSPRTRRRSRCTSRGASSPRSSPAWRGRSGGVFAAGLGWGSSFRTEMALPPAVANSPSDWASSSWSGSTDEVGCALRPGTDTRPAPGRAPLPARSRGGRSGEHGSPRLWKEVSAMLEAGLPAVNICSAEGLAEEALHLRRLGDPLTRDRYMSVRRLGIDDFDAVHDLIQPGGGGGLPGGATRGGNRCDPGHGLRSLRGGSPPGGDRRTVARWRGGSGEIASLYTLTRFLGEGVGGSLVGFACSRARELGLSQVYACTTSERGRGLLRAQWLPRRRPGRGPRGQVAQLRSETSAPRSAATGASWRPERGAGVRVQPKQPRRSLNSRA